MEPTSSEVRRRTLVGVKQQLITAQRALDEALAQAYDCFDPGSRVTDHALHAMVDMRDAILHLNDALEHIDQPTTEDAKCSPPSHSSSNISPTAASSR